MTLIMLMLIEFAFFSFHFISFYDETSFFFFGCSKQQTCRENDDEKNKEREL